MAALIVLLTACAQRRDTFYIELPQSAPAAPPALREAPPGAVAAEATPLPTLLPPPREAARQGGASEGTPLPPLSPLISPTPTIPVLTPTVPLTPIPMPTPVLTPTAKPTATAAPPPTEDPRVVEEYRHASEVKRIEQEYEGKIAPVQSQLQIATDILQTNPNDPELQAEIAALRAEISQLETQRQQALAQENARHQAALALLP